MHVGHFATGLIGKRVDPKLSVGTMILASMLSDVLWCVFMLAGVEEVQITNGRGAGNYFHPINIALSHSLAMLVVWGAIFAGVHKEKACTFEPNGKPCDHCAMCSSRGF